MSISPLSSSIPMAILGPRLGGAEQKPRVAVVTGSISDFKAASIEEIGKTLKAAGVEASYDIVSAHRTPEALAKFAQRAKDSGVDVIIAAAGGAAHLPAMVASFAHPIHVIALPVHTSGDTIGGVGALLANTQMPPGAPLSSVGIGASKNAALEALKVLALKYPAVGEFLQREHKSGRDSAVKDIHAALESNGSAQYKGSDINVSATFSHKLLAANDFEYKKSA